MTPIKIYVWSAQLPPMVEDLKRRYYAMFIEEVSDATAQLAIAANLGFQPWVADKIPLDTEFVEKFSQYMNDSSTLTSVLTMPLFVIDKYLQVGTLPIGTPVQFVAQYDLLCEEVD